MTDKLQTARDTYKRYRRGEVTESSTALVNTVRQMLKNEVQPETLASYVDRAIIRKVNSERRELVRIILELDVDAADNAIAAAASHRGASAAAETAISVCRRACADAIRERIQDIGGIE